MKTLQRHQESVWDIRFESMYKPPFRLSSLREFDSRTPGVVCGMEVISIAQGSEKKTDCPRGVHPMLGSLVRLINDTITDPDERTAYLWPLLPTLIGTGIRYRDWETETYSTAIGRPLSHLELTALTGEIEGYAIGLSLVTDMQEKFPSIERQKSLLDLAVRGYWHRAGSMPARDWTGDQIIRLTDWAEGVKVIT